MYAKAANRFLNVFGVQLKSVKALARERGYYSSVIQGGVKVFETHKKYEGKELNTAISGLVFSKDRAMQLQALLTSYVEQVQEFCGLTVLFKASNDRHRRAYNELKLEFSEYTFDFVEEDNFNEQVKVWLTSQVSDRIFFMTDDAIFLKGVVMNDILHFNPLNEIVSLTKGKDLLYCFTMDVKQNLPIFMREDADDKKFYKWIWGNCPGSPDWSYPLSVDGNVYLREEILSIVQSIVFNNPNSLEANMQLYKPFFLQRAGVCYEKVKLVNVPCNLVQKEFKNRSTGYFHPDELLQLWEEGKRIKVDNFYGIDVFEAEHAKYEFYGKK